MTTTPTRPGKTFIEFFAGIGLVRDGLETSGWSCVYANDINPQKRELYEKRFGGEHFHLGDVWDTAEVVSRIPGHPFLATASFPCVDLSVAGLQRGLDGEHSSAFHGFTRAIKAMEDRKPRVVLLENVIGFITSKRGEDFKAAAQSLAKLGYWLDAFVLDAKWFVPQSRPRVFVVGVLGGQNTKAIAREPRDWMMSHWTRFVNGANRSIRPANLIRQMEATELTTGWLAFDVPKPNGRPPHIAEIVDLDDSQDWWKPDAVSRYIDTMSELHKATIESIVKNEGDFVGTAYSRTRNGSVMAELRFDGLAGCLRASTGGSSQQAIIAIRDGETRARWMSPRELARLQGSPDFPVADNSLRNRRCFGDAVCVPVIRWIDQHVLTPQFNLNNGIVEDDAA